jgi:hypothetical protein
LTEVSIDLEEEEPIYEEDLEVPEAVIEENSSLAYPAVPFATLSRLLKSAILWYARLGYIGLPFLKKTARITKGLPNFEGIKKSEFYCEQCAVNKAVKRFRPSIVKDLFIALAVIEGDLFTIKPTSYNRAKYVLVLVERKTCYRWIVLLKDKTAMVVFTAFKGLFKSLKNCYGRYLACF